MALLLGGDDPTHTSVTLYRTDDGKLGAAIAPLAEEADAVYEERDV